MFYICILTCMFYKTRVLGSNTLIGAMHKDSKLAKRGIGRTIESNARKSCNEVQEKKKMRCLFFFFPLLSCFFPPSSLSLSLFRRQQSTMHRARGGFKLHLPRVAPTGACRHISRYLVGSRACPAKHEKANFLPACSVGPHCTWLCILHHVHVATSCLRYVIV